MTAEALPESVGGYAVVGRAGRGGMGDVLIARDPRLEREVAIKRLPRSKASDEKAISRFRREARVLASLNHPNIATIFSLEEHDADGVFIILEYVSGDTLRSMLQAGPVNLLSALRLTEILADALACAHDAGVLHRDVKPSNIIVDRHGHPRLLDFGLAKLFDNKPEPPETIQDPNEETLTFTTEMGSLIGTAGYMSPEQICGEPVDQRADIFAFACVVFEMLTGTRAFPGPDKKRVLSATLTREPRWDLLPRGLSQSFTRMLRRSVSKELEGRLADVALLRDEAGDAVARLRSGTEADEQQAQPSTSRILLPRTQVRQLSRASTTDEQSELRVASEDEYTGKRAFLCHSCGRRHQWIASQVGQTFLCTCGARLEMPDLDVDSVDPESLAWYRAVSKAMPEPDFDSAASEEFNTEGEGPRRVRSRREAAMAPSISSGSDSTTVPANIAPRGSAAMIMLSGLFSAFGIFAGVMAIVEATKPWIIAVAVLLPIGLLWFGIAVRRWAGNRGIFGALVDALGG